MLKRIASFQNYFADICEQHTRFINAVFLTDFAVVYAYYFFITTMFQFIVPDSALEVLHSISRIGILLGVILALISIASLRNRRQRMIEWILLILICLFCVNTQYRAVFSVLIFTLAATNRPGRKIVWITLVLGSIGMGLSYWGSMNGYIEYLTFAAAADDTMGKHAFGITYHTDAGAHLLNLALAYCFLKPRKDASWVFLDTAVLGFLTFFDYRYIGARSNFLMLLLLTIGSAVYDLCRLPVFRKLRPLRQVNHVFHAIVGVSLVWFLTLACGIMAKNFDGSIPFENILSRVLDVGSIEARLTYSHEAFENAPYFSLWGTYIPERGAGLGSHADTSVPYFFLDSSYIRIPFYYGTVILAIFLGLFTFYQVRSLKKREYYVMFLVTVVLLSGIMEHHIIDFSFVFFLFLIFTSGGTGSEAPIPQPSRSQPAPAPAAPGTAEGTGVLRGADSGTRSSSSTSASGNAGETVLLIDVVAYIAAFASGMIMRYGPGEVWSVLWNFQYGENMRTLLLTVALYFFIYVVLSYRKKYPLGRDPLSQIAIVLRNHLLLATIAVFFIFFSQQGNIISRRLVLYIMFTSILVDYFAREIYRAAQERKLARSPQMTEMIYDGEEGRIRCPAATIDGKIVRILPGDAIPESSDFSAYRHVFAIGCKGIPADYGGFEAFMENLTRRRSSGKLMYHVARTSGDFLRYEYNGAACFDLSIPNIGNAKAIYYDCLALRHSIAYCTRHPEIREPVFFIMACRIGPFISHYRKRIHALGGRLFVNPDGHEWKRGKWSRPVRAYWHYSEKLMVKHADLLICDSRGIEDYIHAEYAGDHPSTVFIPYGSELADPARLQQNEDAVYEFHKWLSYNSITPGGYYLIVGRFVPENNFYTMLREFIASDTKRDLVVITTSNDSLLNDLDSRLHFSQDPRIKFVGTVYNAPLLQLIRVNAFAYLHGHSVGGTNPSLLEAMGSTKLNLLYDVNFNREVGGDGALYWTLEEGSLRTLIHSVEQFSPDKINEFGRRARKRIEEDYLWDDIVKRYESAFLSVEQPASGRQSDAPAKTPEY